nr:T9SS type A sorting domain-containing protein [Bacteroidota bacterium]
VSTTPNKITIYPNPTTGLFSIWGLSPDGDVKIFDMHGQQIQSTIGKIGNGIEINLSGRQTGVYIVRIFSHGEYVYKKLILN